MMDALTGVEERRNLLDTLRVSVNKLKARKRPLTTWRDVIMRWRRCI